MGWSCYLHEVDTGAGAWIDKEDEVCQRQWNRTKDDGLKRSWGRDGKICPWCAEYAFERSRRAELLLRRIRRGLDTPAAFDHSVVSGFIDRFMSDDGTCAHQYKLVGDHSEYKVCRLCQKWTDTGAGEEFDVDVGVPNVT